MLWDLECYIRLILYATKKIDFSMLVFFDFLKKQFINECARKKKAKIPEFCNLGISE